MINYILPIALVILSNFCYHIIAKSMPQQVNPLASLFVTYLTSAGCTLLLMLFANSPKGLFMQFKNINWTSFVLGISIIGLEYGYIRAYRAGWNISICSLVANIVLAVLLIAVGVLAYKEHISAYQTAGIFLCVAGLLLINKQ